MRSIDLTARWRMPDPARGGAGGNAGMKARVRPAEIAWARLCSPRRDPVRA